MGYSQPALNYRLGSGTKVCAYCRNYTGRSCSLMDGMQVSELFTCDRFEQVLTSKPAPYSYPMEEDRGPLWRSKDIQPGEFLIAKADEERRLVFGWANIAKDSDGNIVIDAHGDYIKPEELEKAAYEHVLKFRETGADHRGEAKGNLVESFMVTAEKLEVLGLEKGSLPEGWWVGYRVEDDDLWESVKKGERLAFSIQGMAETDAD